MNTNASYLPSNYEASAGVVFRDSEGRLLKWFKEKFKESIPMPLQTEFRAVKFGLKQTIQEGYRRLYVELDTLDLFRVLQGDKPLCPYF